MSFLHLFNIKAELGTTYILELNYELPGLKKISNVAEIKPFIYRTEGTGRWEVHIPFEAPTSKMITSYFGTMDDKSVPSEGKYFVRSGTILSLSIWKVLTLTTLKRHFCCVRMKVSRLMNYILLSCHGCCQMVQSMPTGICIRGSKR